MAERRKPPDFDFQETQVRRKSAARDRGGARPRPLLWGWGRGGRGTGLVRLHLVLDVGVDNRVEAGGPNGVDAMHGVGHQLPAGSSQNWIAKPREQGNREEGKDETEEIPLERAQQPAQMAIPIVQLPLLNRLAIVERGEIDSQTYQGVKHRYGDESVEGGR